MRAGTHGLLSSRTHGVESVEDIKSFDVEGYSFVEEASDEIVLVFD